MRYHVEISPTFSTTRSEASPVTSAMLKGPRGCLRVPELNLTNYHYNLLLRFAFQNRNIYMKGNETNDNIILLGFTYFIK